MLRGVTSEQIKCKKLERYREKEKQAKYPIHAHRYPNNRLTNNQHIMGKKSGGGGGLPQRVKLNVGGTILETTVATLNEAHQGA